MKDLLLVLLLISGISIALTNSEEVTQDHPKNAHSQTRCLVENEVFQDGEYAEYSVYYNWKAVWLYAGKGKFEVEETVWEGQPVYHASVTGKSAKKFNWFYKVNDRYDTYIDKETMLPLRFIRDLNEGKYTQKNEYLFDHTNETVLTKYRIVKGKTKYENRVDSISKCTLDMLSAVYYTRCLDYEGMAIGDKQAVDMFIDGRFYNISFEYIGKEVVETDFGKFRCVKFSPEVIKGKVFEGDEQLFMWVTDDKNRLPIYIESPIVVGSVKAYLSKFGKLRHELTAKVE